MSVERLTGIEERRLNSLVLCRRWQSEQIDRLLGWEVWRAFATGNWDAVMEPVDLEGETHLTWKTTIPRPLHIWGRNQM